MTHPATDNPVTAFLKRLVSLISGRSVIRTNLHTRGHAPPDPDPAHFLLYFHGGGYAFHGIISWCFAAMLAHHVGAPLFAPEYRLTPEHPHPARSEDAMKAWQFLAAREDPRKLVVVGDSAGGHMMLMLLLGLKKIGQPQPALGIGLCAWTDIGDRGTSLHAIDRLRSRTGMDGAAVWSMARS